MTAQGSIGLRGELQRQVMRAVWDLGEARVEDVRNALPASRRGAYTTVQTVLNRLAERGLLRREHRGNVIVYAPAVSEAEYVAHSLSQALVGASQEARSAALAMLVGDLDPGELEEIRDLAREVGRRRVSGP